MTPVSVFLGTESGPVAARADWAARAREVLPLLPLLAVVALLMAPVDPTSEGGGSAADAASGFLVLYCAVRVVRDRSRPLSPVAALVVGLPVLGICLACVTSQEPAASLPGVPRYLQIFVLVPLAVLLLVRTRREFGVLAWSLIALALAQGMVGVGQYLTGTGASYAGENVRAVGTFGPSDVMGMATVVSYGLVATVGLSLGRGSRGPRTAARKAAVVCVGLLAVPLMLSFSRGAWIATFAACGLQLMFSGRRRAFTVLGTLGALGVVLILGLGVGSTMVQARVSSITQVTDAPDHSVTDRYTMWAAAVRMWRSDPVTGVGLKSFPQYRDSNASLALSAGSDTGGAGQTFKKQALLSPHNMYLLVLGEQGLFGLLALVGSWAALLVMSLRRLSRAVKEQRGTQAGLVAVGLLVWQLIDFAYADIGGPSTVLTSVVLGLVACWALAPYDEMPGGRRHG
ncbi:O-antigen ligase family protein [Streptomyces beijiangensis]|uniref:O-antigen ligase family protein n=1 Tax=Streptomyces beijiangensis TaxID=163361 RepID=A0A939F9W7_9ACTN|nr:O-antigen ligase family protein [Streptomyces beijiangensis]